MKEDIMVNLLEQTQDNKGKKQEFPEIILQKELRENFEYKPSGSRWYWSVVVDGKLLGTKEKAELLLSQKEELPHLVSGVLERTCTLSCKHCLYQPEKSSKEISEQSNLTETILHIVHEMPKKQDSRGLPKFFENDPKFMSCGRILRPWHLEIFQKIKQDRSDVKLGVIDNGTFTKLLSKWPGGFKFDWIDISIDGTKEHHDKQRGIGAFDQAVEGLKRAHEIVKSKEEKGYISSLFTLTKINAEDVEAVADMLLGKNEEGVSLADELAITTMSPTNDTNAPLETDTTTFSKAWGGIKKANEKYPTASHEGQKTYRISLRIYRVEDMEKLAAAVGEKKFMESIVVNEREPDNGPSVGVERNNIEIFIDGVRIIYLPLSIWTPEELLIEADSAYRAAYEGTFTLDELRSGQSKDGQNTMPYTIAKLTPETNFVETYEKAVDHWWQHFGHNELEKEMAAFQRIRTKAKE